MKIKIAILYGGRSGEHDVSCRSAESIVAHLDRSVYDVTEVLIQRDGGWSVSGATVTMPAALAVLGAQDVVFPAMHGPYGEDGTVQSMLELLGIPYVGNGVLASAAGMDKAVSKTLLAAEGLRVTEGVTLKAGDELSHADQRRLGLPVFVKPARAGSSLGVSRVETWADLPAAVHRARAFDTKVVVERAVRGREVDVAILQHPDGRIEAGPPLEIEVVGEGFFDYDAKYAGGAVFTIPAKLDAITTEILLDRAKKAFLALGCRGLLRVDFFLPEPGAGAGGDWGGDPGEPVVNEVNTFPGFTAASQYPRIWKRAGLDFAKLLDLLVAGARRPAKRLVPSASAGAEASVQAAGRPVMAAGSLASQGFDRLRLV